MQEVPAFLRERHGFSKYYSPKLLSIRPIHHQAGEQYKRLWTATYLSTQQQEVPEGGKLTMSNNSTSTYGQQCALQKLIIDKYQSIKDEIVKVIERCYSEKVIEEYKPDDYEALAWMLFVDGCAVLEFMNKASCKNLEALKVKIDQLIIKQQDLLLLENQIPFELLELLCKEVAVQDTNKLSKSMINFLKLNPMVQRVIESQSVPICQQSILQKSTHLLDYLRKILCDCLTDTQRMICQQEGGILSQAVPICQQEGSILSQSVPTCLQSIPQKSTRQQPTLLLDYLRKILCDDLTDTQRMILYGNQTDNQHKETSSVEQSTINIRQEQSTKQTKPEQNWCRDQIETNICQKNELNNEWPRHRNIPELKAAGIKMMPMENYLKAKNKSDIRGIHCSSSLFFSGKLYLRRFVVDDSTGTIYCNLIAYEMCPDFENDFTISSYVAFLDSLIDHPEDVKDLRRNGIIYNCLGSDQEVANLFNTLSTDLVSDIQKYDEVKRKMEKHCNNRLKTWMAEIKYTHFQSPWSVLALLAAILLLGLAIVQTYFTISPPSC